MDQPEAMRDEGQRPQRPTIPLLLLGALLLWASSATVLFFAEGVEERVSLAGAVVGVLGALLFALAAVRLPGRRRLMVALAFLLLGTGIGWSGCRQLEAGYQLAESHSAVTVLEALQDSTSSEFGWSTLCRAVCADGATCKVRLLTDDDQYFLVGDAIECGARLSPLSEQVRQFYRTQGVSASVQGASVEGKGPTGPLAFMRQVRTRALEAIEEHGGEQSALYCALVCGYRAPMAESELYEDFKTCGLAHVVAVSGAHLAIVSMLLVWLLDRLRVGKAMAVLLSVLFVCMYVLFAGVPLSALRSATMAVLSLTSFFARRRAAPLNSIALSLTAFIALDPASCLSVSLFLSAGSTLGILVFSGLLESWIPFSGKALTRFVADPLRLTFASSIPTLPFSAALFSQIPLLSPLANVVAAPLFSLACAAGLLGALIAVLIPGAAGVVIPLSSLALKPLSQGVSLLANLPFAAMACSFDPLAMILLSAVACMLLWLTWPVGTKRRLILVLSSAGVFLAAGLCIGLLPKPDEVIALDVGQGDAILIRSEASTVLIDTGNSDAKLRKELGRAGVRKLDAVIITHADDDHCGSLSSLGGYVSVERICMAKEVWSCGCSKCTRLLSLADACSASAQKVGLEQGDSLSVGRFALNVIWPARFQDEGGNGDSLCIHGCLDVDGDGQTDWRSLFMGDAESDQLDQMLEEGLIGNIDMLKVGHHGSRVSLSESDAKVLDPEVALISVGEGNRYGHPTQEVLACLDSVGCETYRTDESGSIFVRFNKDSMSVRTQT